jgi:ATP-dependent helicase HrpB
MSHPSPFATPLPIDEALPALLAALAAQPNAVLVAPPGAGKTTRVPLALMGEAWAAGQKLIVLEPRRLAARAAAQRMAATLGEAVGDSIGLRARLTVKVSARTRVEVVTEGVFARMILDDPLLTGVAGVLFDEYHERSLDADMGLALALDAQAGLRPDLRLLVMSATLDGARVAGLLGEAVPVIRSEGRAFPVETRHVGRDPGRRIEEQMAATIARALAAEPGSVLAFLPGQGEIRRTEALLRERLADSPAAGSLILAPLYGAMEQRAQDEAVQPAPAGRRKVVLATSIAETSLTIEGVRVVVDSGLARVPRHEPDMGVTRLDTVRVSRAAADQRRGRAGRTEPGVCYRLWDEPETMSLAPFAEPGIRAADLAGLVLDLAHWGVTDPLTLRWLDPPPGPALAEARAMLRAIAALDADGRITPEGQALRDLPLPPRLARMVLAAAAAFPGAQPGPATRLAADLAAVLVERGLGGNAVDLAQRLEAYRRERGGRAEDMRRLAAGWARDASAAARRLALTAAAAPVDDPAALLAIAYPDRIARARGNAGQFLLASGRGAQLDAAEALARQRYLVVAELSGSAQATRILAAVALDEAELPAIAGARMSGGEELTFDRQAMAVRARRIRRLGAITLASETLAVPTGEATQAALAAGIASLPPERWPWSKATRQWRDRVLFLRRAQAHETDNPDDNPWPDLSDAALAASMPEWLAPFLPGMTALADVGADTFRQALEALLPQPLARRVEAEAPTHFIAPTGNAVALDYEAEGGPVLAIRVQELFGLRTHPAIAGGRVPLTLHLLSPAHRPIQITRDLPGFWRGSWASVKTEMKGRYPRHVWPDDPAAAAPTARAKPRGT